MLGPKAPAATSRSPVSNAPSVHISAESGVDAVVFRLLEALMNADYRDQAWFAVAGPDGRTRGAAVFTGPELIDTDGRRVSPSAAPSVLGALRRLFTGAPAQRVRYFAFFLSDLPLSRIPEPQLTPDSLDALFSRGARTPAFPELGALKAERYECVAYVYVIEKDPLTGKLTLIRDERAAGSVVDAKAHLKAAGVWKALGYGD